MGTPLIMTTPLFALGFFGYGVGKDIVSYLSPKSSEEERKRNGGMMSPLQLFCAGAICSCLTTVVVTPVERIKCLLQVQVQNSKSPPVNGNSSPKFNGPWHCGTTLLKEGGISSLYKGFGATFMRGNSYVHMKYV